MYIIILCLQNVQKRVFKWVFPHSYYLFSLKFLGWISLWREISFLKIENWATFLKLTQFSLLGWDSLTPKNLEN